MYLSTGESNLSLAGGLALSATYRSADKGSGLLVLHCTDVQTNDGKKTTLQLDPWSPEGFRIDHWIEGGAVVICGANRIVTISLADLETRSAIPLEYEECEACGQPWFVHGNGLLIIATESRVFCLDKRLAIRWCWTVKVYSQDWWRLVSEPKIEGDILRITLRSPRKDVDVELDVNSAVQVLT
jgi:hypothetical protein